MKVLACPKCSEPMEEGFVIDYTHGAKVVASWVAGPPEKSLWQGGLKTGDRQKLGIATYRCPGCGYLESYATP